MGLLGGFARKGPLTLDGFDTSGADWPDRFKPLLRDCDTVVASPHKVDGTASNDLVLQLRKRRVEKVVLFGPAGNLCVEAHLRDFLEHGFEVAMVRDATAGPANEEGDGTSPTRSGPQVRVLPGVLTVGGPRRAGGVSPPEGRRRSRPRRRSSGG